MSILHNCSQYVIVQHPIPLPNRSAQPWSTKNNTMKTQMSILISLKWTFQTEIIEKTDHTYTLKQFHHVSLLMSDLAWSLETLHGRGHLWSWLKVSVHSQWFPIQTPLQAPPTNAVLYVVVCVLSVQQYTFLSIFKNTVKHCWISKKITWG